jgi:hypothetical protein
MLEVLNAIVLIAAFAGTVVGLIGTMVVAMRHYYLKNTPKTWAWAFFGGPLAWMFGDKDAASYEKFRARISIFALMFVGCSILLVLLMP